MKIAVHGWNMHIFQKFCNFAKPRPVFTRALGYLWKGAIDVLNFSFLPTVISSAEFLSKLASFCII